MTIHIRIDNNELNSERKFRCGIGPELPEGDLYYFESESAAERHSNCPGCNPGGPKQLGTPISELSTRPGEPGYNEWLRISESYGYK